MRDTLGDWSNWLLVLGNEKGREFAAVSGRGRGVSIEHGGCGFVSSVKEAGRSLLGSIAVRVSTAIPRGMIIGTARLDDRGAEVSGLREYVVAVWAGGEWSGVLENASMFHFSAADYPGGLEELSDRMRAAIP